MPGPFAYPLPGTRRARSSVLTLVVALGVLVACADRVVAPDAESADAVTTPVQSVAVSDVVDRVAQALPVGTETTQLNTRIARLREQMESGRLNGATTTLTLARAALQSARAADDGAMEADLAVIELALNDAGQLLETTLAENRRLRRQ